MVEVNCQICAGEVSHFVDVLSSVFFFLLIVTPLSVFPFETSLSSVSIS